MKSLLTALLGGAFFIANQSNAVSRIGGGNGNAFSSPRTGFIAEVSPVFYSSMEDENGLLMLQAPPALTGKGPEDQILLVQDFDLQYPALAGVDLPALERELASKGYQPTHPAAIPCVKTWFKQSTKTDILLLLWGPGLGVAVTGTKTALVHQAMTDILWTLRFPGACTWK